MVNLTFLSQLPKLAINTSADDWTQWGIFRAQPDASLFKEVKGIDIRDLAKKSGLVEVSELTNLWLDSELSPELLASRPTFSRFVKQFIDLDKYWEKYQSHGVSYYGITIAELNYTLSNLNLLNHFYHDPRYDQDQWLLVANSELVLSADWTLRVENILQALIYSRTPQEQIPNQYRYKFQPQLLAPFAKLDFVGLSVRANQNFSKLNSEQLREAGIEAAKSLALLNNSYFDELELVKGNLSGYSSPDVVPGELAVITNLKFTGVNFYLIKKSALAGFFSKVEYQELNWKLAGQLNSEAQTSTADSPQTADLTTDTTSDSTQTADSTTNTTSSSTLSLPVSPTPLSAYYQTSKNHDFSEVTSDYLETSPMVQSYQPLLVNNLDDVELEAWVTRPEVTSAAQAVAEFWKRERGLYAQQTSGAENEPTVELYQANLAGTSLEQKSDLMEELISNTIKSYATAANTSLSTNHLYNSTVSNQQNTLDTKVDAKVAEISELSAPQVHKQLGESIAGVFGEYFKEYAQKQEHNATQVTPYPALPLTQVKVKNYSQSQREHLFAELAVAKNLSYADYLVQLGHYLFKQSLKAALTWQRKHFLQDQSQKWPLQSFPQKLQFLQQEFSELVADLEALGVDPSKVWSKGVAFLDIVVDAQGKIKAEYALDSLSSATSSSSTPTPTLTSSSSSSTNSSSGSDFSYASAETQALARFNREVEELSLSTNRPLDKHDGNVLFATKLTPELEAWLDYRNYNLKTVAPEYRVQRQLDLQAKITVPKLLPLAWTYADGKYFTQNNAVSLLGHESFNQGQIQPPQIHSYADYLQSWEEFHKYVAKVHERHVFDALDAIDVQDSLDNQANSSAQTGQGERLIYDLQAWKHQLRNFDIYDTCTRLPVLEFGLDELHEWLDFTEGKISYHNPLLGIKTQDSGKPQLTKSVSILLAQQRSQQPGVQSHTNRLVSQGYDYLGGVRKYVLTSESSSALLKSFLTQPDTGDFHPVIAGNYFDYSQELISGLINRKLFHRFFNAQMTPAPEFMMRSIALEKLYVEILNDDSIAEDAFVLIAEDNQKLAPDWYSRLNHTLNLASIFNGEFKLVLGANSWVHSFAEVTDKFTEHGLHFNPDQSYQTAPGQGFVFINHRTHQELGFFLIRKSALRNLSFDLSKPHNYIRDVELHIQGLTSQDMIQLNPVIALPIPRPHLQGVNQASSSLDTRLPGKTTEVSSEESRKSYQPRAEVTELFKDYPQALTPHYPYLGFCAEVKEEEKQSNSNRVNSPPAKTSKLDTKVNAKADTKVEAKADTKIEAKATIADLGLANLRFSDSYGGELSLPEYLVADPEFAQQNPEQLLYRFLGKSTPIFPHLHPELRAEFERMQGSTYRPLGDAEDLVAPIRKYVINLPSSHKRLAAFASQPNVSDFLVQEAVLGKSLTAEEIKLYFDKEGLDARVGREHDLAELGCALAHLQVLRQALLDPTLADDDWVMVCEDDTKLNPHWYRYLNQILLYARDQLFNRPELINGAQNQIPHFRRLSVEDFTSTHVIYSLPQLYHQVTPEIGVGFVYKPFPAGAGFYLIRKRLLKQNAERILGKISWVADDFERFLGYHMGQNVWTNPQLGYDDPSLESLLEGPRIAALEAKKRKLWEVPILEPSNYLSVTPCTWVLQRHSSLEELKQRYPGFSVIPWVDYSSWERSEVEKLFDFAKFEEEYGREITPQELNESLQHFQCWRSIKELDASNYTFHFIIEDGQELIADWRKRANATCEWVDTRWDLDTLVIQTSNDSFSSAEQAFNIYPLKKLEEFKVLPNYERHNHINPDQDICLTPERKNIGLGSYLVLKIWAVWIDYKMDHGKLWCLAGDYEKITPRKPKSFAYAQPMLSYQAD